MNYRMMAPEDVRYQSRVVNGRSYTGTAGQIITVPDSDGAQLQANNWTFISFSGPTTARPSSALGLYPIFRGCEFFDESLNKLIKSDGVIWFDPATGAVV